VGQYKLVLTETAMGAADHGNHYGRRQEAIRKATRLGITNPDGSHIRPQDVQEDHSTGVWVYTWTVSDPTDFNVCVLVGIFNGFRFVSCPGPVPDPCTFRDELRKKKMDEMIAEFSQE